MRLPSVAGTPITPSSDVELASCVVGAAPMRRRSRGCVASSATVEDGHAGTFVAAAEHGLGVGLGLGHLLLVLRLGRAGSHRLELRGDGRAEEDRHRRQQAPTACSATMPASGP